MSDSAMLIVNVRKDVAHQEDAEQELSKIKRALAPVEGLVISATYAAKIEPPSE